MIFSGKTTNTGGLSDNISDEDLKEFFGQFGKVVSVKQIKNKETGKHKVGINEKRTYLCNQLSYRVLGSLSMMILTQLTRWCCCASTRSRTGRCWPRKP